MKGKPREVGDKHVQLVYESLENIKRDIPLPAQETARYIRNRFSGINKIQTKFESNNPDATSDLTLTLKDNRQIKVNLFILRKGGKIQTKNPGAKSFFKKYFLSNAMQGDFNREFELLYRSYLIELLNLNNNATYFQDFTIRDLKILVKENFPRFTKEINHIRDDFLYQLREECFQLLKKSYNFRSKGLMHAFNTFFMTEDFNLITYYSGDKVEIEEFNPKFDDFENVNIYKKGKNTVGIKCNDLALTLRFKFESNPTSSIKLASSYEEFESSNTNRAENLKTVEKMEDLIKSHVYTGTGRKANNAIGKTHESLTYYFLLKSLPNVTQITVDSCVELMNKYYAEINPAVIQELFSASSTIVEPILERIKNNYSDYEVTSIELVPESYIKDRLDTGDLELVLKSSGKYYSEKFSLKALGNSSVKLTAKNPGMGSILGPLYFNIGDMSPLIKEVKENYDSKRLNRRESLEVLSKNLGKRLKKASQPELKRGIENLLGVPSVAITLYKENRSVMIEHSIVDSTINVLEQKPTNIQTTLEWEGSKKSLSLRAKFSRGESHGWSSVKLAAEYQVDIKK